MRGLRVPVAVALVAACAASQGVLHAQQPAAQQQLTRAATAVDALKTTRFTLTREGAPAALDATSGITFTGADCGYVAPARVSCDIKVSLKNGTIIQMTRVWVPEGTFQSNPLTRQFMKLPADQNFNGTALFAKDGIAEVMRSGVQNPQVVGTETIRSESAQHVKGEVSGAVLNRLLAAGFAGDKAYPVEIWIAAGSGNPLQLRMNEAPGTGWTIALAAINEPLTIPTPQVPASAGSRP